MNVDVTCQRIVIVIDFVRSRDQPPVSMENVKKLVDMGFDEVSAANAVSSVW